MQLAWPLPEEGGDAQVRCLQEGLGSRRGLLPFGMAGVDFMSAQTGQHEEIAWAQVMGAYFSAWCEPDPDKRAALLALAWAEDGL